MTSFTVPVGQTVKNATIDYGDVQLVYGTTITEVIHGSQDVYGKDIGSTILGLNSSQAVYGTAIGTKIDNVQVVESGGRAIGATVNTIGLEIGAYGAFNVYQYVDSGGTAIGTTVNLLGYEFVLDGATGFNTTVNSGGNVVVAGGGKLEGLTVIDGGVVNSLGTAAIGGRVEFVKSGGLLAIGGEAANFTAKIVGFSAGDTLDLADVSFGTNTTLTYDKTRNGGVLTVTDGVVTESVSLLGKYTQSSFALSRGSGRFGGTPLTIAGSGSFTLSGNRSLESGAADSENVTFTSDATGTLKLDYSLTAPFTGYLSGLSTKNAVDLADLAWTQGKMKATFSGNTSGGTLTVTNGTSSVALKLFGNYTTASWTLSKDSTGGTRVVDPPVTGSLSADANGDAAAGIDLSGIGFGANTTLAYSANSNNTGGTLTVSDGLHAQSVALLGQYMASSLVMTSDGHGGTLIHDPPANQLPLLTHPHA